ncbi:Rrp15p-domain-containing protein [Podospora didyma]|uniref:Rrp15p-domain-containing protein n=1 Tax=Podospora didyma TaxID=330526 RepID=A0AAE0K4X3_9PEZI|nr:Rrp15p-domain-containing protein [Podospora didyma]
MAGSTTIKKRSFSTDGLKGRPIRPTKKQRKMAAYHSSSEDEGDDTNDDDDNDDEGGAIPSNLLDSDNEDLENMEVDDGASPGGSDMDSDDSDAQSVADNNNKKKSKKVVTAPQKTETTKPPKSSKSEFVAKDAPDNSDGESDSDGDEEEEIQEKDTSSKSKRNDSEAFATSISKMLSSKLPTSKRADPIVARSSESAAAARQLVDASLEAKARRRLREQKRLAMEKGRVRDVLVASTTRTLNIATGEIEEVVDEGAESTAQILATERRLRKVAQRGVVKLFNAVRAAQVKAADAERAVRTEGIVGIKRKEEKITEMSRKGFLDLIAGGGGGSKKVAAIEEA